MSGNAFSPAAWMRQAEVVLTGKSCIQMTSGARALSRAEAITHLPATRLKKNENTFALP
jgi:hypothetical protein